MKKSASRILISLLSVFVFSFCVVFVSEYIQKKEIGPVIDLFLSKAGVVLFCTVIVFLFTMAIAYITKSLFCGALISGAFVYILSCVEFYKYGISGSHLVFADLTFVANMGEIAGFADIKPEVHLVKAFIALVFLLVLIYQVKMPFPRVLYRSLACSVACCLVIATLILPSAATELTYSLLDFDTEPALTTLDMNARFDNDGFLGFLSQNATEHMAGDIVAPNGYSEELMSSMISSGNVGKSERPNVVIIASESFSDLREVNGNLIPDDVYEDFDKAAAMGNVGTCILPTFGGYTVRTEFELLFGLPSLSMSNPPSPHSKLDKDRDQNTTVGIYRENGYKTTYIHAFNGEFYGRNEMYPQYGFQRLIFGDEFQGEDNLYRRYIDDFDVMDKIFEVLKEDDEPSYIFAMTMQNHQPYVSEDGGVENELQYYLDGIKRSSAALYEFLSRIRDFEEETIVLFLGDHLPFFTPQGKVYDRLGVYDGDTEKLYSQKYLLYSNCQSVVFCDMEVSAFYLPHLLIREAGLSYGGFTGTMLGLMKDTPVYSIAETNGRNEKLDAITYDRTLGECWVK